MSPLKNVFCLAAVLFLFILQSVAGALPTNSCLLYIASIPARKSQGIYVARFDTFTGKIAVPKMAAATPRPTFVAFGPKTSATPALLYAVNAIENGTVSAFSVNPETGNLTLLNQQSSKGKNPCYLSVDATGKCLMVANYDSGSIAAMPIKADGSLEPAASFIQHTGSSVNLNRQQGPHAHWIETDPANHFALTCDLGMDKVLIYTLDSAKSTLVPNEPAFAKVKPGSGPRHLSFHPQGRFAYLLNEMAGTVIVFLYDGQHGTLKEIQSFSTVPADFVGQNTAAELEIDSSGRFLYASNRGHDSLAVFGIDPQSGKLSFVGHHQSHGKTPRCFAIDPTGRWLIVANQGSDNLAIFRIDQASGKLAFTGQTIDIGAPVCVKFAQ